jgi:ketosteroid isomerase-like protein
MKMRIVAASLLVFLGACSKEAPMPLDVAQSKMMIWELVKAYHESVDKQDWERIGTFLTPDASLILSNDVDVIRGQKQVVEAVRTKMKSNGWDPETRSTITGKEVIKPDGTTAVVTYVASVGQQRGLITVVCTRLQDNKWLIQHIHDTWSMDKPKGK